MTNHEGQYVIHDSLTYREGACPFMWMTAEAAGYVPTHSMWSHRMNVVCTEDVQVINIPMEAVTPDPGT